MSIYKGERNALLLRNDRSIVELYKGNTKIFGYNSFAEGETISVDNVHPVEHKMRVSVKNKNLLPNIYVSQSNNRVDFTVRYDKSVLVNGTATQNTLFEVATLTLPSGVYVLSGSPKTSTFDFCLWAFCHSGGVNSYDTGRESIFSVSEEKEVSIYIKVAQGITCANSVFYPRLTVKEDFDPTVVTIKRCNKNLLYIKDFSVTNSTIVNRECADNVYKLTSVASALDLATIASTEYVSEYFGVTELKPATYYFKHWILEDTTGSVQRIPRLYIEYEDGTTDEIVSGEKKTITQKATITSLKFDPVWNFNAKEYLTLKFMLSVSEIEEYEKPVEPVTYTPAEDGTVEGITSVSPNMTLMTDTDGAVIECGYVDNT